MEKNLNSVENDAMTSFPQFSVGVGFHDLCEIWLLLGKHFIFQQLTDSFYSENRWKTCDSDSPDKSR